MLKFHVAALALIAAPSAVGAQSDARPILWNDVRVGMTEKEVDAIHHNTVTKLAPDCGAELYVRFKKKLSTSVYFMGFESPTKQPCPSIIANGLRQKYGDPRIEEADHEGYIRGRYTYSYWTLPDGLNIKLKTVAGSYFYELWYTRSSEVGTPNL